MAGKIGREIQIPETKSKFMFAFEILYVICILFIMYTFHYKKKYLDLPKR